MYERLSLISDKVNYSFLKDRIEKLFNSSYIDNWIVGFINGEGCFYLNKNKCNFSI